MKATLLLAAALAFATSAAQAQTVAPGTAPGAQTGNPSNMPSAGSPAGKIKDDPSKDMSGKDKRMMRKEAKMKTNSDGTTKTKMKM